MFNKFKTYYIKTFGCQLNEADSQRIEASLQTQGMERSDNYKEANYIVINTCLVRQSAEERIYGLVRNIAKIKKKRPLKIIVTGCLAGLILKDKTGKYRQKVKTRMPEVDEYLPIEEIGFDVWPVRENESSAHVPISNGCNNFCTFCVVPYTRGKEISRPSLDIINECRKLLDLGYKDITLLGQNVNSYGADLIGKHLGRQRPDTLFPYLLEDVAGMKFAKIDFLSSNPWDFSNELIEVIAKNPNITRTIHLPVQSGDNRILKLMNRRYTAQQYLNLINKIRRKVPGVEFTTDIIVGFCSETEKEFQNTVKLAKAVGFKKAYISKYSPRPMTKASENLSDDVPFDIKKKRWIILEELINRQIISVGS